MILPSGQKKGPYPTRAPVDCEQTASLPQNVIYLPRPERPELLPDELREPLDLELLPDERDTPDERELPPDERDTPDERELPPDERDTPEDLDDRDGALRPTLPDDLLLGAARLTVREELGALIRTLRSVLRVRLVRPLLFADLALRLTNPPVRERVEDLFTAPDVRAPVRVVEPDFRPRVREVLRDIADREFEPKVVRPTLPEFLPVLARPAFSVLRVVRPTEFFAAVELPDRTIVRVIPRR